MADGLRKGTEFINMLINRSRKKNMEENLLAAPLSPFAAVIVNISACTYIDFKHLLSKQPTSVYCPLLNDKILTKKRRGNPVSMYVL